MYEKPYQLLGESRAPIPMEAEKTERQSYQRKINSDPIINAYNKAYKKHFAWIRYRKITKEAFYVWSEQARAMRDKCLEGKISCQMCAHTTCAIDLLQLFYSAGWMRDVICMLCCLIFVHIWGMKVFQARRTTSICCLKIL